MTPVQLVLARLPDAKRNGRDWSARCPGHSDEHASLSIGQGDDGRALLRCHAGCTAEAIVAALGVTMRDLMPVASADVDTIRATPRKNRVPSTSSTPTRPARQRTFPTAHDAVAELERQHGPRSATWAYHNAAGDPVGVIVRWDRPGGTKDIRPVSRVPAGWVIGGMLKPRPLYNLPALAGAPRVYITEGEKAADAVRSVGLTATTSPHGSQGAGAADWSPLAGKFCLILPDADDAGRQYADDVVRVLARLLPAPTVKIVELPGLPAHGDAVEYVAARRAAGLDDAAIRAEIEALADAADPVELAPAPVVCETFHPFPTEALPEPIRCFVRCVAAATSTDPSYAVLAAVVTIAGCVGNRAAVIVRRGWSEPAVLWGALVGRPGSIKSQVIKLVTRPLVELYKRERATFTDAQAEYERACEHHAVQLAAWKHAQRNGPLTDPPVAPQPPREKRVLVSDLTVEKLGALLQDNPLGLLVCRDELAGWIGSFDRYAAGGKGSDQPHYMSMYDAAPLIVDRKCAGGSVFVERAAVSVLGGIQPRVLERVFGMAEREAGLLGRVLLVFPPDQPSPWTDAELPDDVAGNWRELLAALLAIDAATDDDGDPRPRLIPLAAEARAAYIGWHNRHVRELAEIGDDDLRACFAKLKGTCLRLALVFACADMAGGAGRLVAISAITTRQAIIVTEWFKGEARRAYGVLAESDDARERRRLVELIQRKGGVVTVRDLMRGSRLFTTAADAEAVLTELVNAGLGRWVHNDHDGQRGRPVRRFALNDADTVDADTNSANPDGNPICVNVGAVNTPNDDATDCPDDEQPPDDVRFAAGPEIEGTGADEWGDV